MKYSWRCTRSWCESISAARSQSCKSAVLSKPRFPRSRHTRFRHAAPNTCAVYSQSSANITNRWTEASSITAPPGHAVCATSSTCTAGRGPVSVSPIQAFCPATGGRASGRSRVGSGTFLGSSIWALSNHQNSLFARNRPFVESRGLAS